MGDAGADTAVHGQNWRKICWRGFRPLLLLLLAGCASVTSQKPAEVDQNYRAINEGYGLLYRGTQGLKHAKKVLYVKSESEAVEATVTAISDYAAMLSNQLETLAEKYPRLNINETGLPEMEKAARAGVLAERLKNFAPIVGKAGKDFERTALLSLSGGLNQMRHLTQALSEAETDNNRRIFLLEVRQHFDKLYDRVVKLLEAQYFSH